MLSQERKRQIETLLDEAEANRGRFTGKHLDLLDAAQELLAEVHRRTPLAGRRIPCPFHDDQPASRCKTCRDEATPPPPNWRDRTTTTEENE